MTGSHWSDSDVEWLRHYFPELSQVPLYLLSNAELPEWQRESETVAWHFCYGDLRAKPVLEQQGRWQGRGIFIGVSDSWWQHSSGKRQGTLLHELSHGFETLNRGLTLEANLHFYEEMAAVEGGVEFLRKAFNKPTLSRDDAQRNTHGLTFVRAALHCWYRCRLSVELWDVWPFSVSYHLDWGSADNAVDRLLPELQSTTDIVETLRTDPPAKFAELFQQESMGPSKAPG